MSVSPTPRHQLVVRNLSFTLHMYLTAHNTGTMMFAPLDVVLADAILREKNVQGAPNRVTVCRRSGAFARVEAGEILTTPLLPGFSLELDDVFAL